MVDLKMEVYSPALELLGFLEVHKSVIWAEKAFSAGSFSVESLITPEALALLRPENIIWIEGDTAGIIEYVQESADESGPYITVKGRTLTGILDRRILWGLYSMTGTPPEIMHRLVDDCCINPTRGNTEARKIPGLALSDVPTGGASIRIQKTGGTLLEALEQLGETYGVAFGVRFNAEIPRMEFWTRWGRNLTMHQSDNPQVFYSTELDDVLESEYTYNSQDYRNVSLVAGEGEGSDRVYVTVEEDIEETPDTPVTPPEPSKPQKYTVSLLVDPAGGGTASGGKTVAAGVSVTVTATPSEGYTFAGWSENGDIVSTSASYTFTVNSDRTLTAVFAALIPVYVVSVSVDPSGGGTVSGGGSYEQGQSVTLTQTTADGYRFTGWYNAAGTLLSADSTYTFTPTENASITAKYAAIPTYTVTASIDPAGSGTVTGAGQYQEGDTCTLVATVADGYSFTGWQEGGATVSESAEYTFTVTGDRALVAVFAEVKPSRLPAGYTEVEYVHSDDACGIDTGINPITCTKIKVEVDIQADAYSTGTEYIFSALGYKNGNTTYWFSIWRASATTVGYRFYAYSTVSKTLNISGERITVIFDGPGKKVVFGDNEYTHSITYTFEQKSNLFLWGAATAQNSIKGKLYSAKVYNSGVLQRDFVPCVNPSGAVGLYDLVGNKFYGNAFSGTLTAGPAV